MRTVQQLLFLSLWLNTGCLSLSAVPQSDESVERDASPPDAGRTPRDAGRDAAELDADGPELPDADAPEEAAVSPCGVCDGSCEQGRCVPAALPKCEPGVKGECIFESADVDAYRVVGDTIFWVDRGTTDAFNNPRNDGTIVRTRIGEWTREVLVDGLDFYQESTRQFFLANLWASDDVLVWWTVEQEPFFLSGLRSGPRLRGALKPNALWCFAQDAAYRFEVRSDSKVVVVSDRYDGVGDRVSAIVGENEGAGDCLPLAGYLYGPETRVPLDRLGAEPDLPVLSKPVLHTVPQLPNLWSNGTRLFKQLADGRIGVAPNDADFDALPWTAITPPSSFLHADRSYVYAVKGTWPNQDVFRVRLADKSLEEVVDVLGTDEPAARLEGPQASSYAVLWRVAFGRPALHVVPLPSSAPMQ